VAADAALIAVLAAPMVVDASHLARSVVQASLYIGI
jgi:hypothetical protein